MEETIKRRKRVDGFYSKSTTFFREYDNGNLLNRQNGGSTTNAVKHRMQCIRFQAEKYFMCKRPIG